MNTQTYQLPETVKIETLAKWLDKSDPKNPRIRFTLAIHGPHGRMECPYSGGLLAFLPVEKHQERFLQRTLTNLNTRPAWMTESGSMVKAAGVTVSPGHGLTEKTIAQNWIVTHSAVKPLGVVHSLINDTRAGEMTFPDFCGEYGYDEDSRKAFQTWQDCQNLGNQFKRIMGPDLFAAMEEGLQDY